MGVSSPSGALDAVSGPWRLHVAPRRLPPDISRIARRWGCGKGVRTHLGTTCPEQWDDGANRRRFRCRRHRPPLGARDACREGRFLARVGMMHTITEGRVVVLVAACRWKEGKGKGGTAGETMGEDKGQRLHQHLMRDVNVDRMCGTPMFDDGVPQSAALCFSPLTLPPRCRSTSTGRQLCSFLKIPNAEPQIGSRSCAKRPKTRSRRLRLHALRRGTCWGGILTVYVPDRSSVSSRARETALGECPPQIPPALTLLGCGCHHDAVEAQQIRSRDSRAATASGGDKWVWGTGRDVLGRRFHPLPRHLRWLDCQQLPTDFFLVFFPQLLTCWNANGAGHGEPGSLEEGVYPVLFS